MPIVLAIDVHKIPVAIVGGHRKHSSKRIKEGLERHIAEGSTIVGNKERARNALVRAVRCTHARCKADVRDPAHLERVSMVNNLCSQIKWYLWRFAGMEMEHLQSYLNGYVYLLKIK